MAIVRYVANQGSGSGSGNTYANAAPLSDIVSQVSQAAAGGPGSEVQFRAEDHFGIPNGISTLNVGGANKAGTVALRGAYIDGRPGWAYFEGNRRNPYDSNNFGSSIGPNGFKLAMGAQFLTFDHMWTRNTGAAFIQTASSSTPWVPMDGITVTNLRAENVQRAIFANTNLPFVNFTAKDLWIKGVSKAALRFNQLNFNTTIERFYIDCDNQQGDSFSSGLVWNSDTTTSDNQIAAGQGAAVTSGSTTITTNGSGSGASFIVSTDPTMTDVGKVITGANIPANTTIVAVASANSATMSAAATGTSALQKFRVWRLNSGMFAKNGVIKNIADSIGNTAADYWNGDAIAGERSDDNMQISDVYCENISDGGVDTKATNVTVTRVTARRCKRSFRIWTAGAVMRDCRSYAPVLPTYLGVTGSGSKVHLWTNDGGVTWLGGVMDNEDNGATVMMESDGTPINVGGAALLRRQSGGGLITTGSANYGPRVRFEVY